MRAHRALHLGQLRDPRVRQLRQERCSNPTAPCVILAVLVAMRALREAEGIADYPESLEQNS